MRSQISLPALCAAFLALTGTCAGRAVLSSSARPVQSIAPARAPTDPTKSASSNSASGEPHAIALQLVELTGARARLLESRDKSVQSAANAFEQDERYLYSPEYVAEWSARMKARYNPDDYLAVIVRVFEAHYDAPELQELVQAQGALAAGKQPDLPEVLKSKLAAQNIEVQSEVIGGCSQVGAKIGAEIGQQIQKEHPDWVRTKIAN